jgi:hypothetical protein
VEVPAATGAMHQVSEPAGGIAVVEFGFDLDNLFLRVDGVRPMDRLVDGGVELVIRFVKPDGVRLVVRRRGAVSEAALMRRLDTGRWTAGQPPAGVRTAIGTVAEVQIPFSVLGLGTGDPVALFVGLVRGTADIDRQPGERPIELEVPDRRFAALNWTA